MIMMTMLLVLVMLLVLLRVVLLVLVLLMVVLLVLVASGAGVGAGPPGADAADGGPVGAACAQLRVLLFLLVPLVRVRLLVGCFWCWW